MKNKKRIDHLDKQVQAILEIVERILDESAEKIPVEGNKIEVDFWKEGIWYTDGGKASVRYSKDGCIGYTLSGKWSVDIYMGSLKRSWRKLTSEEIKEVLTRRCKELGLFDSEFGCLTGDTFRSTSIDEVDYWEEDDKFWIGKNLAYEEGKFAEKLKTVEKTFLEELTEWLPLDTREDFQKWLDGFEIKKRNDYGEF